MKGDMRSNEIMIQGGVGGLVICQGFMDSILLNSLHFER